MKDNSFDKRKRAGKVLNKCLILLCFGLIYAVFVGITKISMPCIFNLLTGLYCPGCGITRMFMALIKFDFLGAAKANVLVLFLLPIALAISIYKVTQFVKTGSRSDNTLLNVIYYIILFLTVAFGILRNFEFFYFLAPH